MKPIKSGFAQAPRSESRQLSTSQAAGLCSVKPDTVVKWVKKGQLRAAKTAGGHHRIEYRDLESFLRAHRVGGEAQPASETTAQPVRCSKLFCPNSCEDCAYYRGVKGLKINVLVVSQDEDLIGNLAGEKSEDLSLCFVHNGYEASAAIDDFRPAFAAVDRDLDPDGGEELVECLTPDLRAPGLKIILAVPGAGRRRRKESEKTAVEVLVKPFGLGQVKEAVKRLPVESVVVSGHAG